MRLIGLEPVGEGIKACEEKGFTYTNHNFFLSSTLTWEVSYNLLEE